LSTEREQIYKKNMHYQSVIQSVIHK